MHTQTIRANKHPRSSRIFEQRSEAVLEQSAKLLAACRDTVRLSGEIVQDARKAVERARRLRKRAAAVVPNKRHAELRENARNMCDSAATMRWNSAKQRIRMAEAQSKSAAGSQG